MNVITIPLDTAQNKHKESKIGRQNWTKVGQKVQTFSYKWALGLSSAKARAPHSSALAWKIPWTEEPGGLQSMGSWRVGHDWATSLSLFTFMHWRRKCHPTPVLLPGKSHGRRSLVGYTVHGVAKSRTRLSDFTLTFHFHASEKEMATHSSVLAWRIPGTGEPDGLPSMGSHRVGHDWSDLAAAAVAAFIEFLVWMSLLGKKIAI